MLNYLSEIVKSSALVRSIIIEDREVIYCNLTISEVSDIFDFLNEKKMIKQDNKTSSNLTLSLEGGISGNGSNEYITTGDFEFIKDYFDNKTITNIFKNV